MAFVLYIRRVKVSFCIKIIKNMKHILRTILLITSLGMVIASCRKEAVTPDMEAWYPQGAADCPDRGQFVAGKTYRQYLEDYRQLSPAKQKCMWEDKLAHSLQFFTDQRQRNFIAEANDLLTITRFTNGNPEGFEESFMAEAKLHFTFEQTARVFFVLHDYDNPPLPMGPNAPGGGNGSVANDCECYYSIYCGVMGVCVAGRCDPVGGCGVFGSTTCKGFCEQ
jgi:hypothetical protein